MTDLLRFWFSEPIFQPFWFDGSKDKEIYDRFNEELIKAENMNFDVMLTLLDNQSKLHYLIVFDQLTRNISRITGEDEYRNDDKALKLAQGLCCFHYDEGLPFLKRIFILLPLRHSNKLFNLNYVIKKLNGYYDNLKEEDKRDYERFYLATLKNYTHCTDNISTLSTSPRSIVYQDHLHDTDCSNYTGLVPKNIVSDLEKFPLYISILKYCQKYKIKRLGVSLSGGVDSMVLLWLLQQMVLNGKSEKVVAIHVNYNWECRLGECEQEAKYLLDFCSHIDVDLVLRDITHLNSEVDKRINVEREFIDEETKQIRFNTYKHTIQKYNLDGICLGHHKGDLIENVFMNFSKGKNILDLFVTKEYDLQYDVPILRPMLDHNKQDIFDIAHQNNIIYFKDTTPDWSFRGTMRKKIFPTMTNFDQMILGNFYRMGQQSAEWGSFINRKLINPILKNTKDFKYGFVIKMNIEYDDIPVAFWAEVFVNLFHSRKIRMIKHTNMKSYIEWINEPKRQNSLLRLSNGYLVFRNEQNIYFIRMDVYEKLGVQLKGKKEGIILDTDQKDIAFGSWKITLEKTDKYQSKTMSFEDLLGGFFEYDIENNDKMNISVNEKIRIDNPFRNINIGGLTHIIPKVNPAKKKTGGYIRITMRLDF